MFNDLDLSIKCICGKTLSHECGFKRIAPCYFQQHVKSKFHQRNTNIDDEILIKEQLKNYNLNRILKVK